MEKIYGNAERVKKTGGHKKFVCLIGIIGGCDSSHLISLAIETLDLCPLVVHLDNTWFPWFQRLFISNTVNKR